MSDARRAEVIEKVRDILISDWDPIGVGGNPNLRDEYDGALAPILQALARSSNAGELTDLLTALEARYGAPRDGGGRTRAVEKLLALRESVPDWPNA